MEHTKSNKSKILALILGLTMCLALMLGIVFASPTNTVYAEEAPIETLEVAFRKVGIGDSLADAFDFENETTKNAQKFQAAQTIRQRSYSYPKTDKQQRYGKKTVRRFRGAGLKTNRLSRKSRIAFASFLRRKKTISCPNKQTCLKAI